MDTKKVTDDHQGAGYCTYLSKEQMDELRLAVHNLYDLSEAVRDCLPLEDYLKFVKVYGAMRGLWLELRVQPQQAAVDAGEQVRRPSRSQRRRWRYKQIGVKLKAATTSS